MGVWTAARAVAWGGTTLAAWAFAAAAQPQSPAASLRAFEGRWACAGTFANGRPIASTLTATWDAPTGGLVLRQDDVPPGAFHALEVWGAHGPAEFRATIIDAHNGVRWLTSPGWVGERLTWTRSEADRPAERFVFSRPVGASFTVEWFRAGKDGSFALGDSLKCVPA